ncbi:DUF1134 domain-containing protein [Asticcacaulis sp. EMRT-3]|uniref:DUF1134 domain-containing protein n=1 Tax=Asticcacaulis sp. EMRT-3 TaxID=3040349 RepID=UPI0024AE8D60|nr:DUF1134 domain-containing protein [Asticcacaulis sp. EMRT-3]MDI7774298.1 DUF1134 domain-containing protein [Asticcacaulis sp. EMRT-3]
MKRRQFLMAGMALAAAPLVPQFALAQNQPPAPADNDTQNGQHYYSRDEILQAGSNFLGVTVEALGGAMEKIFADYGDHPTAYIAGQEVSGAVGIGLNYGKGMLYMKDGVAPSEIYWQGPSIGFDTGANASRVFTLVYNLREPIFMYRRFPGVEGSAYFIGGLGVTYQRAEGIILAPIRAGVGFRLGANVGYMSFSKKRRIFPL